MLTYTLLMKNNCIFHLLNNFFLMTNSPGLTKQNVNLIFQLLFLKLTIQHISKYK